MKVQQKWPYIRLVQTVTIFIFIIQITPSQFHEQNQNVDDFDEELYSVIASVKDGSLWDNQRVARSVQNNFTTGNEVFSDNVLWNDLWFECQKKASFSCIRTGMFKYLDKSLEWKNNLVLTDSLSFLKNKNKVNGECENSEEGKERCLRYDEENLKVKGGFKKGEENTKESNKSEENEIEKKGTSSQENISTSSKATGDSSGESNDDNDDDITETLDNRPIDSLKGLSEILYDKGSQFLMTHDMEVGLPQLFFGGGSIKLEPKSFVEGNEDEEEGVMVKIVFKPPKPSHPVEKGRIFGHIGKLFKKKLMHSFMALLLVVKMIKVKLMFLLPMIIGKATAKKLLLKVLLFLIPGLAHLFKLCHYYHMEHAKYHHHHHKIKHHHHHIQIPVPVPVPVHLDHSHNIDGSGPSGGGYEYDYPPYPEHLAHGDDDSIGGSAGIYSKDPGSFPHYKDNDDHLSSWGLGSSNYEDAGVLDAKNQPLLFKNHPYGAYYSDHSGSHSQQYGTKLQVVSPGKPPPGTLSSHHSYDPFYSPILQKIDNVFDQMGFTDEGCRERVVCSMYKSPHRFSPHSNLLSNELSRDPSDLQKPVVSNGAVLRFYRYIQAARDGQDQRDCLRIYSRCAINTDQ